MARYLEAVDVCPAYAAAYYNQGVVHSERGRLDAATASYRRAVELLPAYAEAWCNLGVILRSQVRSAGDWQGVVWRSHERL
jgi:tetratricopeptide (TPR) repeat protein